MKPIHLAGHRHRRRSHHRGRGHRRRAGTSPHLAARSRRRFEHRGGDGPDAALAPAAQLQEPGAV